MVLKLIIFRKNNKYRELGPNPLYYNNKKTFKKRRTKLPALTVLAYFKSNKFPSKLEKCLFFYNMKSSFFVDWTVDNRTVLWIAAAM
jgi:hypothetical protein